MDFKDIKPVSPSGELDEYIEVSTGVSRDWGSRSGIPL